MRYLSVCSGIEAATVAWHPLGWTPAAFAEIEKFPRAVLAHHYPDVPLHGDFTTIGADDYGPVDLLVGGTPCQSFSIAGLRGGLDDDRGNLALEFLRLAKRKRPKWVLWENVPGVLSSNKGRDFGSILGGFRELGYGFAWRVLDAQYLGVAQRRRRVFVVGYLGDWRRAAAVLFERQSLCGDSPPRRETRETASRAFETGPGGCRFTDIAPTLDARCKDGPIRNQIGMAVYGGGQTSGPRTVAATLVAHGNRQDFDVENFVTHTLRGEGFDASEDGSGRGIPLVPETASTLKANSGGGGFGSDPSETFVPVAFSCKDNGRDAAVDMAPTLRAMNHATSHQNGGGQLAVAFTQNQAPEVLPTRVTTLAIRGRKDGHQLECRTDGTANAILTPNGGRAGIGVGAIHYDMAVRRLSPRECERLQGFSDDYTLIQWRGKDAENCPDGPRYKALGNSMAVPVMRWIGERIGQVSRLEQVRLTA